jgi:hypothetical protein
MAIKILIAIVLAYFAIPAILLLFGLPEKGLFAFSAVDRWKLLLFWPRYFWGDY